MNMKPPANRKARALRAKLEALVERGINGERVAARKKLDRLLARVDFTAPDPEGPDLFAGNFARSYYTEPILSFTPDRIDFVNQVKWAIENATGIECVMKAGVLHAHASASSAARLASVAQTVEFNFGQLWAQYVAAGADVRDRANFILGLYDGMMGEERHAQQLPARLGDVRLCRAKKKAIARAPGLNRHPYSVAVELGKAVRFSVPLDQITARLEATIKGEIQ